MQKMFQIETCNFFYVLLRNIIGEASNSEFFFPDPTDKKQQKDTNTISFQ